MGSDSVDGYDALYQVGKVVFEKEGRKEKKEERIKDFTQSKLHSLPHLFHPREL